LNREEAFYYEILLTLGYSPEYDEWLNTYLKTEDPLSDIVLDLAWCGSDKEKAISILRKYRMEESVDEENVCNRIRLFLKNAYHTKRLNKEQVATAMYAVASHIGGSGDFDTKVWGDMFCFDEYYSMAKESIITWEQFDSVFLITLILAYLAMKKRFGIALKNQLFLNALNSFSKNDYVENEPDEPQVFIESKAGYSHIKEMGKQ